MDITICKKRINIGHKTIHQSVFNMNSDDSYLSLRTFFIKNTSIENVFNICKAIGIPNDVLKNEEIRYKKDFLIMLSVLFNRWYRVAINVTSMHGITPKLMLAYGYYSIFNRPKCHTLLEYNNIAYEFIADKREYFVQISDTITLNYLDISKLPFGIAKALKLR